MRWTTGFILPVLARAKRQVVPPGLRTCLQPRADGCSSHSSRYPCTGGAAATPEFRGIGLIKREFLSVSRSPQEIAAMKAIKAALDPNGILNPGKVI
jgi:FAD linked oxidases, C-terminal domain